MLSKEGKSLLRKVRLHILAEPRRLNMDTWIKRRKRANQKQKDGYATEVKPYPFAACGTAGCIAGWTVLLHDGMKKGKQVTDITARSTQLLGLEWSAGDLYYVGSWDEPWQTQYMAATTPEAKAKIAGAYINHYIKTRGSDAISTR